MSDNRCAARCVAVIPTPIGQALTSMAATPLVLLAQSEKAPFRHRRKNPSGQDTGEDAP